MTSGRTGIGGLREYIRRLEPKEGMDAGGLLNSFKILFMKGQAEFVSSRQTRSASDQPRWFTCEIGNQLKPGNRLTKIRPEANIKETGWTTFAFVGE